MELTLVRGSGQSLKVQIKLGKFARRITISQFLKVIKPFLEELGYSLLKEGE